MAGINFCDVCKKETGRNTMPSSAWHNPDTKAFYHMCGECWDKVDKFIVQLSDENEGKLFVPKTNEELNAENKK